MCFITISGCNTQSIDTICQAIIRRQNGLVKDLCKASSSGVGTKFRCYKDVKGQLYKTLAVLMLLFGFESARRKPMVVKETKCQDYVKKRSKISFFFILVMNTRGITYLSTVLKYICT